MNDWVPATEIESAMRDALLAGDQELYFRILAQMELLLPVSRDVVAGRAPLGWGTWTTGNRTHILAFTSTDAMRRCLSEPPGSSRTVPFQSLAAGWPNHEWWLAINPGLPIEAYLPSWFLAQLTQGEVHLSSPPAAAPSPPNDPAWATAPVSQADGTLPRAVPPASPVRRVAPRLASSDLAAAISGRIRASQRASAASATAAGEPFARRMPEPGAGFGFPARPLQLPNDLGAAAFVEPRTEYVNAYGGVVETVEAEIIDSPPAAGSPTPSPRTDAVGYASPPGSPVSAAAAFSAGRRAAAAAAATVAATPAGPPPSNSGRPSAGRPVRETFDAEIVSPDESWAAGFTPANETEAELLAAAGNGNTDAFLSTLLLASIVVPIPPGTPPTASPKDPDFPWEIEEVDGGRQIAVFTSPERLAEYAPYRPTTGATVTARFVQIISAWPDEEIGFAVNPGSPVGATLPGSQIVALANWAADVGLRDDRSAEIVLAAKKLESAPAAGVAGAPTAGAGTAVVMQRTIPHGQVKYYLDRGYDRVAGFVNRASEVAHLTMPRLLYRGLGLIYPGSPFAEDDAEVHVLRWVAHRPDLYRLPYGGQNEAAMRAMQGWVIERSPFRGNGFAPGEIDVVAEFKVDSVRLPHGAQMWRLTRDGTQTLVATFDADSGCWIRAEESADA